MKLLRTGYSTAIILGLLWGVVVATCAAISLALFTGAATTPGYLAAMPAAIIATFVLVFRQPDHRSNVFKGLVAVLYAVLLVAFRGGQPFGIPFSDNSIAQSIMLASAALGTVLPLSKMLSHIIPGPLTRHEFEESIIRFLTGFGYVFFTAIVAIPFFIMVMTSFKSQQALLLNPLDYSLDLSKGWGLFRSYVELFRDFNFGRYLVTSFFVATMTVLITLLFSIPGAYAVARLRFKGQSIMSRSILLIYMVPMIVLALPIYIAFSLVGLRNSLFGILLIYPVTTIPVALYMLQGYFRGLPAEIEEAGLMDGLTRLKVIWQITLPLSLPAIASVSLYVFMIGWNEFLLAFMLLDDPSKFTLTRGVAMLNSSEIPRQHLMAGSVIATIPIMIIFLGLERFMTKGLTAGSVKG
ncbi:MAG TPA: carbohydrate ABC transporter permease [Aliiroseovarius sp.]|nr:carbohydrate ABC transporter permease [Aliiroseovarius sp.]